MQLIPLLPEASQTVTVSLAGQPCTVSVYEKSTGLYMDLSVNNVLIIGGVRCRLSPARHVLNAYLGFVGDFTWIDTAFDPAGKGQNPKFAGIGSKFFLIYLEASDLNGLG